jgi:nucleotide-binding universal stress UspA family protein
MMTVWTPEIKTILIPVDGSEHAHKAALIGAAIAARFGARVILLHVLLRNVSLAKLYELARIQKIPSDVLERFKSIAPAVYDFGLTVPAGVIHPVPPTDLLVEIGRHVLETEKADIEGQGAKNVEPLIEDGDAAHKILEIIKKEKADFVVMGRRGLGALEGILSGSVSTKVGHLADATVVSVT